MAENKDEVNVIPTQGIIQGYKDALNQEQVVPNTKEDAEIILGLFEGNWIWMQERLTDIAKLNGIIERILE